MDSARNPIQVKAPRLGSSSQRFVHARFTLMGVGPPAPPSRPSVDLLTTCTARRQQTTDELALKCSRSGYGRDQHAADAAVHPAHRADASLQRTDKNK